MARDPMILESGPATGMWTTVGERPTQGKVHYAFNMLPISVDNANARWIQRGRFERAGSATAAGSAVRAHGQLSKVDGTEVTWLLSSSSGLWAYDWNTSTYSNVVTSANFTTAGISLVAATHYWCVFNNTVCFNPSNGSQVPFTWDGTSGAGGLVELTNAPTAYGKPTTFAAKLFFVKYAERDTIVWSEEATANTGYEAGGYSNVWKLGQTGTDPLFALQGTNEELFYFRGNRIGSIRGQVSADFVTTATHDAVSESVGTLSPNGVTTTTRGVWFLDQWNLPTFIPKGGVPQRLVDENALGLGNSAIAREPLGFDDTFLNEPEATGEKTGQSLAVPILPWLPYETVWFNLPSDLNPGRVVLVVSQDTGSALGWVKPTIDDSVAMPVAMQLVRSSLSRQTTVGCVDGVDGRLFLSGRTRGPDQSAAGVSQTMTYRLVGAPLGHRTGVDWVFDQIAAYVSVSSAGGGTHTLSLQCLTSRQPTEDEASTAQTATIPYAPLGTGSATSGAAQRLTFGLRQQGRYIRPVLTMQSASAQDFTVDGWAVSAFPLRAKPTLP